MGIENAGEFPGRPEARLIRSPADAEEAAARWMRYFGFVDAMRTPTGADLGVDVRSSEAIAQVKAQMVLVGRPDLQRLHGVAVTEGRAALFFSLMHYTAPAVAWAEVVGMALFRFDHAGEPEPVNSTAKALAAASGRGEPQHDDLMRRARARADQRARAARRLLVAKFFFALVVSCALLATAAFVVRWFWEADRQAKRHFAALDAANAAEEAYKAAHTTRVLLTGPTGDYRLTVVLSPPKKQDEYASCSTPEAAGTVDVPFRISLARTVRGPDFPGVHLSVAASQQGGAPDATILSDTIHVGCKDQFDTGSVSFASPTWYEGIVNQVSTAGPDPSLVIHAVQPARSWTITIAVSRGTLTSLGTILRSERASPERAVVRPKEEQTAHNSGNYAHTLYVAAESERVATSTKATLLSFAPSADASAIGAVDLLRGSATALWQRR